MKFEALEQGVAPSQPEPGDGVQRLGERVPASMKDPRIRYRFYEDCDPSALGENIDEIFSHYAGRRIPESKLVFLHFARRAIAQYEGAPIEDEIEEIGSHDPVTGSDEPEGNETMKFKDIPKSSPKNFLKLTDKQWIKGVFRGDIEDFRQHWVDGQGGVVCPGRQTCDLCAQGEKSAFRFRVNLVTQEDNQWVAKTFEQGKAVYEAMKSLADGGYDLEHTWVKIQRLGMGTDTTYTVVPFPKGELSAADEKTVAAVPLNTLIDAPEAEAETADAATSDIPF